MRPSPLPALLLFLATAGCGEPDAPTGPPVLRFSAIPNQDATLLVEKFRPVAEYLSRRLGVPVEYRHSTDYAASVEAFKNGDVLLAWFGGLTGVQARHAVPGAHAIVQGEEDREFHSVFVAHRDTGLVPGDSFPEGIAGRKFTFGSKGSTSGRLMPEHFLRQATGKRPEEYFSAVNFSGDHDKTAELVESGQFEVGVMDYKVYERRVETGKTDPEVCRVIWRTPSFADYNFTAHPDLEERYGKGFTERLRTALVEMTDSALLAAFPRRRLVTAEDGDYETIRQVALALEFIRP
jgi:phosphonate transport system substrate-binding protein